MLDLQTTMTHLCPGLAPAPVAQDDFHADTQGLKSSNLGTGCCDHWITHCPSQKWELCQMTHDALTCRTMKSKLEQASVQIKQLEDQVRGAEEHARVADEQTRQARLQTNETLGKLIEREEQLRERDKQLIERNEQLRERNEDLKLEKITHMEDLVRLEDIVRQQMAARDQPGCDHQEQVESSLPPVEGSLETAKKSLQPVVDIFDLVVCSMTEGDQRDNVRPVKSCQYCPHDAHYSTVRLTGKRKRNVDSEDDICQLHEQKRRCVRQ